MAKSDYMIIFDLDDTLYKEIDFLHSAYREIAAELQNEFFLTGVYDYMLSLYKQKVDVFGEVIRHFHLPLQKDELLQCYRNHKPHIVLSDETRQLLGQLSSLYPIGLITDGRSITQRNKIEALGLMPYLCSEKHIIISEEFHSAKPSERNYRYFQDLYPEKQFIYVGDNVEKDFIAPNHLDWNTICLLDDGRNIHPQSFEKPKEYLPRFKVRSIGDIGQCFS